MNSVFKILAASLMAGMFAAPSFVVADGEADYKTACFACHDMAVAGAPKLGDQANWAPRIAQGNDVLVQHVIAGYQGKSGFMPPRGGSMLSDEAIAGVVEYMVGKSQ